jgi:hypothetical protein
VFALFLVGCVDHSERRGFVRLGSFLGFAVPREAQLIAYRDDFGWFEFSQSWLIQFSMGSRPWESSSDFRECLPDPNPAEDYSYILSGVHSEFPAYSSRFQHPRIWRGGKDGNCYIASSDDGTLIYFHYFTT